MIAPVCLFSCNFGNRLAEEFSLCLRVYLSVFVACVFVCVRVYAYWILVLWSD